MKFWFIAAIFLASARLSAANAEEFVASSFKTIQQQGILALVGLVHPDELKSFRKKAMPMIAEDFAAETHFFKGFADPADSKKIRNLSDIEFMRLFLESVESLSGNKFADSLKGTTIQVIGHVTEGDVQHVVVRVTSRAAKDESDQVSVASVKEFNGEPKLLLSGFWQSGSSSVLRSR